MSVAFHAGSSSYEVGSASFLRSFFSTVFLRLEARELGQPLPSHHAWEAIGLLALSRILFGGFGRGGSHQPSRHRKEWWKKAKRPASSIAQPGGAAS